MELLRSFEFDNSMPIAVPQEEFILAVHSKTHHIEVRKNDQQIRGGQTFTSTDSLNNTSVYHCLSVQTCRSKAEYLARELMFPAASERYDSYTQNVLSEINSSVSCVKDSLQYKLAEKYNHLKDAATSVEAVSTQNQETDHDRNVDMYMKADVGIQTDDIEVISSPQSKSENSYCSSSPLTKEQIDVLEDCLTNIPGGTSILWRFVRSRNFKSDCEESEKDRSLLAEPREFSFKPFPSNVDNNNINFLNYNSYDSDNESSIDNQKIYHPIEPLLVNHQTPLNLLKLNKGATAVSKYCSYTPYSPYAPSTTVTNARKLHTHSSKLKKNRKTLRDRNELGRRSSCCSRVLYPTEDGIDHDKDNTDIIVLD